jgi:hypothetical protein
MKVAAYMAVPLITFLHISLLLFSINIHCCMFCMRLFNFVNYVFLLLCVCILIVMYVPFWVLYFLVLFCVLFVCKCVLYYCHWLSTQLQLTSVSYNIITGDQTRVLCQPLMAADYGTLME